MSFSITEKSTCYINIYYLASVDSPKNSGLYEILSMKLRRLCMHLVEAPALFKRKRDCSTACIVVTPKA